MLAQTTCPGCGKRYKVPDSAWGKRIKCPACGIGFVLPDGPDSPVPLPDMPAAAAPKPAIPKPPAVPTSTAPKGPSGSKSSPVVPKAAPPTAQGPGFDVDIPEPESPAPRHAHTPAAPARSGNLVMILALAAMAFFVLIGGLGVGVYFATRSKPDDRVVDAETPDTTPTDSDSRQNPRNGDPSPAGNTAKPPGSETVPGVSQPANGTIDTSLVRVCMTSSSSRPMYATGCFLAKNVVALPRYAVPSTGTKREYEVEINPGKPNSRKVPAKLVGMSSPSVMVLHVQGKNLPNPIPLSDIAMADSGDSVTVYGLSFAEPGTGGAQSVKATLGRSVSSTSRMMILTMASRSIVPGGPIVNAEGKLVGFASRNSSASSSNPNLYMMPASSIADVIAKIPDLLELQTAKESAVVVVAADGLNKTVLGTGTVVQPGYVVTCAQKLTDNWATLGQGRATYEIHASVEDQAQQFTATLFAYDPQANLALFRVEGSDLPPIKTASTGNLAPSQIVRIIGHNMPTPPWQPSQTYPTNIATVTTDGQAASELVLTSILTQPDHIRGGPVVNASGAWIAMVTERSTGGIKTIPVEKVTRFVETQIRQGGQIAAAPPMPDRVVPPQFLPRPTRPPMGMNPPPPVPRPGPVALADVPTIKLPGTATDSCVGAAGNLYILHIASIRQIAIIDLVGGKLAKLIPTADDNVRIAAGMTKLLVFYPNQNTVSRYDLTTFEKEVTAPLPISGVKSVTMGSASYGPVLVTSGDRFRGGIAFLDPIKIKTIDFGDTLGRAMLHGDVQHYRASPDGTVFGSWCSSHTPSGINSIVLRGKTINSFNLHETGGFVIPAEDGTIITAKGIFSTELKPLGGDKEQPTYRLRVPAQNGRFYVTVPGGGGAQHNTGVDDPKPTKVFQIGDAIPLATLPDVELPTGNEAWTASDFTQDKRLVFNPEAKVIAVLPPANDRVLLHPFDLEKELNAAGIDYLFVTSRPPSVVPGKPYEYQVVTKSKKGGVKYKLDAGPVGMKMTPEGKITWTAPAFVPDTWSVIVSVSDASGQERFHTFTLQVAQDNTAVAKEPKVGAAPPEPVVPAAPIAPIDLVVKPAALTQDEQTVNLPSSIGQVAVGAGGRLLILHLPKDRKLAIFDTAMAKIVKYLPLAEDTVAFAAGAKSLIVLLPTANVIQRWNLATLEKEVTLPNPIPTAVKSLAMGSASHGPLVVVGTGGAGISLYDPRTLKASEYSLTALRIFHPQYPPEVRVSANGETIAAWVIGLSPSGVYIWSRQGSEYKASHQHDSYGSLLPTPDGKMVFALGRLLTPDGKPIGEVKPRSSIYIPAVQGTAWLSVEGGGDDRFGGRPAQRPRLHIHLDRDTRPLVTLNEPTGLENLASADQRIFLVQDAKLMAIVPPSGDKLVLHRFDIDAMLDKAGIDYLLVVGSPPSEAPLGGTFRYTPSVKSKKGGVKIKLDSGPEGMTLGADNTLTWAVPKDAPKEVNVILTISDATGQEVFHTFKLATKTLD